MGRSHRPVPKYLSKKLYAVRQHLHLTQEEMVERLMVGTIPVYPGHISDYELGKREPPLQVLLEYARLAGIPLEILVDDRMMLPEQMQVYFIAKHTIDSEARRKGWRRGRPQIHFEEDTLRPPRKKRNTPNR